MPRDAIETRYCQFVDVVINYHRLDRLGAYLTPDVIDHAPRAAPGLDGARRVLASYSTALPDFHLTIEACWPWRISCSPGSRPPARTRAGSWARQPRASG